MSVLIKDMEKPKFCHAITDGEAEFCPFVNTDDDCVLLSKKGICEETWEMQYSKCPLVEVQEPCENDKGCSNCMYSGRPTYKSPCAECRDNSQWEMKPISRSHENGTECEDAVSRKAAIEAVMDLCKHYTLTKSVNHPHVDFVIEALQDLPPVTPKRKTGEWIHSDFSHEFLYCSECGRGRYFCSNFCPNCGADMRQREENK
jgi:hypothetical protein